MGERKKVTRDQRMNPQNVIKRAGKWQGPV